MSWLRAFIVASILHVMAWSMYFAITRFYIVDELGGGYTALSILVGVEWGLPALSIVWGRLADVIGRRRFIALGATGAIAFALMGFVRNPYLFIVLAAYASLAWGAAYPAILAPVLTSERIGSRYGIFAIGNTLGWALGSLMMGFIRGFIGTKETFLTAALLYIVAYIIFYIYFPKEGEIVGFSYRLKDLNYVMKRLALLAIAIACTTLGVELGHNIFAVKLRHEVEHLVGDPRMVDVMYGLVYGTIAAFIGTPFRVVAGRIVDRYDPTTILMYVSALYAVYYVAMYFSYGILTLVLWQIPLYSFYDVAVYTSTSMRVPPELKSTVAGMTIAAQSIGGLLVAIFGPWIDMYGTGIALIAITLSLLTSTCLLCIDKVGGRRYRR